MKPMTLVTDQRSRWATWIPSHFEIRPVLLWAATVTSSGRERQWTCPLDLCQSLPMPLLRTSHHHGFVRCAVWLRRWESAPKPLSPGELGSASPLIPTRILISFPTRISDGHQRLQAKPVGRERQKWVGSSLAAFRTRQGDSGRLRNLKGLMTVHGRSLRLRFALGILKANRSCRRSCPIADLLCLWLGIPHDARARSSDLSRDPWWGGASALVRSCAEFPRCGDSELRLAPHRAERLAPSLLDHDGQGW